MKNKLIFLLMCLILTSCNSLKNARTNIQPISAQQSNHIEQLASGSSTITDKNDLVDISGRFRTKLFAASKVNASPSEIYSYLDTGIAVVSLYCREFFKQISVSAAHRSYLRSEVNDVGGFFSGLLGLTEAGSKVTGGTGALFSLLDSSVENYDTSYLVSPDLPAIEKLVIRAQATLATELLKDDNKDKYTFPQAERALADFANTCTFNGIKSLANDSVNSANVEVDTKNKTLFISSQKEKHTNTK